MRASRLLRLARSVVIAETLCLSLSALGQTTSAQGAGSTPAVKCPRDYDPANKLDTPTITIDDQNGKVSVSGNITKGDLGTVVICDDTGAQVANPTVDASGAYSAKELTLKPAQNIQAQFVNNQNQAGKATAARQVDSCSKIAGATGTAPTLAITASNGKASFSGALLGAKSGTIRICVNDLENGTTQTVDSGGKYDGGTKTTFVVTSGDKIVAQEVIDEKAGKYGPISNEVDIVDLSAPTDDSRAVSVLIGGVEYSGYSAQSQTTNGFLNIFYRGPVYKGGIFPKGLSGWARIRLTSTPQQATNGVVSVIADPTGLTTHDYSSVGQALDYVFGPSWSIANNWSIVAGIGATTPLSSQNTPVSFVTPAAGTVECTELVQRFSAANGYSPALTLNTAANATTCLQGGYADIAFSNQDRSSFLLKYGTGLRTTYPFKFGQCNNSSGTKCSTAYAALDATVGQDASVTGGQLRRLVFKLDGQLPIPTGSSSWLYLFGSSYIRLEKNNNLPPLLLSSPPSPVTVPSTSVIVLPLRQPNRDYYRLGVGVNINQLWCKAFGSGCTTPTNANANPTTPTTPKTTTPAKTGAAPKG